MTRLHTVPMASLSLFSALLVNACSGSSGSNPVVPGLDASSGADATSNPPPSGDAGGTTDAGPDSHSLDAANDGAGSDGQDAGVTPPGTYAFLGGDVLSILNATDPTNITLAGTFNTQGYVVGVAVADGAYTYATSGNGMGTHHFVVLDTSVVSSITMAASLATEQGFPLDGPITLSGNYAYLGEIDELEVVDVSNPSAPVHAGTLALPEGGVRSLTVSGQYAYMAIQGSGGDAGAGGTMLIADVSNPATPSVVAKVSLSSGWPWGIAVSGSYAYLGVGFTSEVEVYDVSTPSAPTQVATLASSSGRQIAPAGGYAYIAPMGKLQVADISNPLSPMVVATGNTTWPISGVTLGPGGTRAYVAGFNSNNPMAGHGSLEVFDITTPTSPTNLGSYLLLNGGAQTAVAVKVIN